MPQGGVAEPGLPETFIQQFVKRFFYVAGLSGRVRS